MSRMDECMDTLATQLLEVIHKKNWSITVAADFMYVNRNKLADILNRKAENVSLKAISQMADSLDRPVASLICKEELRLWENEQLLRQIQSQLSELQKSGVA
mgnify:CR=1 FL=1